jgi:hypothetical protein
MASRRPPAYVSGATRSMDPYLLNGKADAQVICVDPTLETHPNFTLLTNAYVTKLQTDAGGHSVNGVYVQRGGRFELYSADIVVFACGALSSALLLLRSASNAHPMGLANSSGQVGRNHMRHNQSILMVLMREPNDTVFQKTLALSDYYFSAEDWEYLLGLIQMCATSHGAQIRGEALPDWLKWVPKMPFEAMARHSMDFWLLSEDLPRAENRIYYDGGRTVLDIKEGNMEAHHHLKKSSSKSCRVSVRIRYCWSETCISARTFRSVELHTRRAPLASAPTRPSRCWTSTAKRTNWTICM